MTDRVTVIHADSREALKTLAENSIDSCVTDPPYALVSIVKRFGKPNAAPAKSNDAYIRASSGFMGQAWDTGEAAFDPDFWREVLRVLKPGSHLVAFSGTRTYHRMACAIEDAGFEIRDQLQWLYGSGFPKSHDVSKGIDRHRGCQPVPTGQVKRASIQRNGSGEQWAAGAFASHPEETKRVEITRPSTADAAAWEGWGTALKPASEPIVLARKPLSEKTVAANVLKWGTGALNIDGCRIGYASTEDKAAAAAAAAEQRSRQTERSYEGWGMREQDLSAAAYMNGAAGKGRWPANVIHDGSDEVVACFPNSDGQQGDVRGTEPSGPFGGHIYGDMNGRHSAAARGDTGSAARFFYAAKADADDRLNSKHPTVKPVDLMQWLVRLVTPKGGLVLDPFAGTGTTGEAAWREGFRSILIEREERFIADICRRIELMQCGPFEKAGKLATQEAADSLPLFAA